MQGHVDQTDQPSAHGTVASLHRRDWFRSSISPQLAHFGFLSRAHASRIAPDNLESMSIGSPQPAMMGLRSRSNTPLRLIGYVADHLCRILYGAAGKNDQSRPIPPPRRGWTFLSVESALILTIAEQICAYSKTNADDSTGRDITSPNDLAVRKVDVGHPRNPQNGAH